MFDMNTIELALACFTIGFINREKFKTIQENYNLMKFLSIFIIIGIEFIGLKVIFGFLIKKLVDLL